MPTCHPTAVMGKVQPPPWPDEPMARLLWYVTTPGVELWLPTAAEEAEVYEAAEAAKPKMPRIMAPTVERPRSPQRPDLSTRRHGGTSERPSRIKIPAPPPAECLATKPPARSGLRAGLRPSMDNCQG